MEFDLDLSEWNDYAFELITASGRVGKLAADVVRKSALDNERDQKLIIVAVDAVDTGNLLNSVSTEFEGDGRSSSFSALIGPTANYGIYVELGTSRMPGRPYVGPAFDRNLAPFIGALALVAERSML